MRGSYIACISATLTKTRLAAGGGFALDDVRCACEGTSWSEPEQSNAHTLVFVRRGSFRRRVDGVESVLDPLTAYFERPGEEQQVAHPVGGGDVCTQLTLPDDYAADGPAAAPLLTRPDVDLAQRLLLNPADEGEFVDGAVAVADAVLDRPQPLPTRRPFVSDAREALASNPSLGLLELARAVAVSPHHLSRTFRAETGESVSRYRNRVRVRLVLERLVEGEDRLARLAAELGFADQAHLSRVVREELGQTPSELRTNLQAAG